MWSGLQKKDELVQFKTKSIFCIENQTFEDLAGLNLFSDLWCVNGPECLKHSEIVTFSIYQNWLPVLEHWIMSFSNTQTGLAIGITIRMYESFIVPIVFWVGIHKTS